ncbi:MAG: type 4b pilus protein PilO2 [Bdellovibrionales bacterium]
MTMGIVTVGRKQYVSGLYWENSPSGRISQAAKEAARQPGAHSDYYVTRSGTKQGRVPQFGLGTNAPGVRSGLPSLAGCLANQQPGSWIGAFHLREGTALVIVRDDLIVPDGDQFFLDEVEARDRLYQEIGVGGFLRIYAPEAWGIPGSDSMPLTLLLNDRTDVRLKAVALSRQGKMALIAGGMLLVALIGIGMYIQDQRAKEEALRAEQMAALERMRQEAAKLMPGGGIRPEYPKPERVWEKFPHPMAFLDSCRVALDKVSLRTAGWNIISIECIRDVLTVRWSHYSGNSDIPEGATVTVSGDFAVRSVPLTGISPRGAEDLKNVDFITKRYLNQNWPATLARAPDDAPPPPPEGYTGEWNPPPPPWVKRSFTFNVPVLPWAMGTFLDGIPGIIIQSAVLSGNGIETRNGWKIDGVIYENRQ